ncbi:hypothetical protein [Paenibacillus sp. KN14-4R]|uniref:hypothetical protein n=1 Tax=Paenibacillus sp. KN14-4R TaxID=3445773 RepID=UPI003FA027AA
MTFVLQHRDSEQIYTRILVNHYELAYYGVQNWSSEEEAQAHLLADPSLREQESKVLWEVLEVSEHQLKMFNVKLKNDPKYLLYWSQGTAIVKEVD